MSKIKSIFVTALFASMLGLILCGLFLLESPVFGVLVAILAAYGGALTTILFYRWLRQVPPLLPAPTAQHKHEEPTEDTEAWQGDPAWADSFAATYDEIKAEIINEN